MTPSFIGLIATTLPGVRPSISFASRPTATTSPVALFIATIDGSFTTIPLPAENTSVFAVPRSIARSEEKRLNTDLRLYPFLFIPTLPRAEKSGRAPNTRKLLSTGGGLCAKACLLQAGVAAPLFWYHNRYLLLGRPAPPV